MERLHQLVQPSNLSVVPIQQLGHALRADVVERLRMVGGVEAQSTEIFIRECFSALVGLSNQEEQSVALIRDEFHIRLGIDAVVSWCLHPLLPPRVAAALAKEEGVYSHFSAPIGLFRVILLAVNEDESVNRPDEPQQRRLEAYEKWLATEVKIAPDTSVAYAVQLAELLIKSPQSVVARAIESRWIPDILATLFSIRDHAEATTALQQLLASLSPTQLIDPLLQLLNITQWTDQKSMSVDCAKALSGLLLRDQGMTTVLKSLLSNTTIENSVAFEQAISVVKAVPSTSTPEHYYGLIAPQLVNLLKKTPMSSKPLRQQGSGAMRAAVYLFERSLKLKNSLFRDKFIMACQQLSTRDQLCITHTLLVDHAASALLLKTLWSVTAPAILSLASSDQEDASCRMDVIIAWMKSLQQEMKPVIEQFLSLPMHGVDPTVLQRELECIFQTVSSQAPQAPPETAAISQSSAHLISTTPESIINKLSHADVSQRAQGIFELDRILQGSSNKAFVEQLSPDQTSALRSLLLRCAQESEDFVRTASIQVIALLGLISGPGWLVEIYHDQKAKTPLRLAVGEVLRVILQQQQQQLDHVNDIAQALNQVFGSRSSSPLVIVASAISLLVIFAQVQPLVLVPFLANILSTLTDYALREGHVTIRRGAVLLCEVLLKSLLSILVEHHASQLTPLYHMLQFIGATDADPITRTRAQDAVALFALDLD